MNPFIQEQRARQRKYEWIGGLIAVPVILALLCIPIAFQKWKWDECRKVGHGVAYCVWKIKD